MKKYNLLLAIALLAAVLLCAASCGKSDIKDESSEAPADVSTTDVSNTDVSDPEGVPPLLFPETSDIVDVSDDPAEPVMCRRFVYEKPGFGGNFDITLLSDGTYNYCEGFYSSYIGMGEWTLEDGILTMTEHDYGSGSRVFHFGYSNDALTYIAEGSNILLSGRVADGDKFDFDKEYKHINISPVPQVKRFMFENTEKDPVFSLWMYADGTFSESIFSLFVSSKPAQSGTWSEKDGIITLTPFDSPTYRFRYNGSSLVYIDDTPHVLNKSTLEKGDVLVSEYMKN